MDNGSSGAGFALGFFFGIVGVIIAIAINKPETRRGAVSGFFTQLGLAIAIVLCIVIGDGLLNSIF